MKAETRDRIMAVARELDYELRTARSVRALGARATNGVGLLLSTSDFHLGSPFWSLIIGSIQEELVRRRYHVSFMLSAQDVAISENAARLSPRRADGIIVLGDFPVSVLTGQARSLPVVQIPGEDPTIMRMRPLPVDLVGLEKRYAILSMVAHLVSLGHRRLAYLGVPGDERAWAFGEAMQRHGLRCDERSHIETGWTDVEAYGTVRELFRSWHGQFDALVCNCDLVAIGAIRAARESGLRLPDDVAITGFDDLPLAGDVHPALTTISVPKRLIGELAVRTLFDRISRPDRPPIIQLVPTHLVVRESCGSARPAASQAGKEDDSTTPEAIMPAS